MSKKINYIGKAITKYLKPVLEDRQFYKTHSKVFQRIRGDIIDTIEFQMSQYGSEVFYIHYYCSLLPSDKEYSYGDVRYRDERNENDNIRWIGDNEENANNAMHSLINALEIKILPWFDSIATVEDYMIENYHINAYSKNITNFYDDWIFRVVGKDKNDFISKGKQFNSLNEDQISPYRDKMLQLMADNKLSEKEREESLSNISEKIKTIRKKKKNLLRQLFKDTKNIVVDEMWLEKLREDNIKENKLEKVIIVN
jgi:hypothetical protein